MNKFAQHAALALTVSAFLALGACSVEKTEDGSLPEVEVTKEGSMPAYDVETADVSVGTRETQVTVPDVDVSTKETTMSIPDVDVTMPDEKADNTDGN